MKRILFAAIVICLAAGAKGQKLDLGQGTFMMNAGMDVYHVPRAKFFLGNVRPSLDLNYFAADKFALGLGFDYRADLKTAALEPGLRFYPAGAFFVRGRGYLPTSFQNIDASAGIGYDWALTDKWAIETNADYYFSGETVFRFAFALFL